MTVPSLRTVADMVSAFFFGCSSEGPSVMRRVRVRAEGPSKRRVLSVGASTRWWLMMSGDRKFSATHTAMMAAQMPRRRLLTMSTSETLTYSRNWRACAVSRRSALW